jgi:hypothetical protein
MAGQGVRRIGVESTKMALKRRTIGARTYNWSLTHIFAILLF